MLSRPTTVSRLLLGLQVAALAALLAACGIAPPTTATETPPSPSPTAPPPTATPEPLAARVNSQAILLREFQGELARYEAAQRERGIDLATLAPYRLKVLQSLIDLELLAQKGAADGTSLPEEALSQRIDQLAQERGGSEAMAAWMAANAYDLDTFRRALRRELLAQGAVTALAEQVPEEVEHVHLRHILVDSRRRADEVRSLLAAGADFGTLALEHSQDASSRVNGGDLGWVPAGVLNPAELDEAALTLPAGQISGVIETELGYHLIEVRERQVRPLSPNDRRILRQQAVEAWLETARDSAQIEILIEP